MLTSHPDAGVQERLGIIERVANAGRAWKYATFTCLGLLGLSLAVHASGLTQPHVQFKTIELACDGKSRIVDVPDTLTFRQVHMHRILQDFVSDLRGISPDSEVVKAQWRRLREQVTPAGAQMLNQAEAEANPLGQVGAVVVKIVRVQQREATRYDVRWQEIHYGKNGERGDVVSWGGLFTFEWGTPKVTAPLGMYFRLWQVQKEV